MLLPQPVKAALRKVMQRFVRILFPAQLPAHNCIHRYRQLVLKRRFPMLKQSLLVLLAASVISIAAPIAAAQSPNTQPSAQGNGGSHHGPPDPAQRTHELTRKLKLTTPPTTKKPKKHTSP